LSDKTYAKQQKFHHKIGKEMGDILGYRSQERDDDSRIESIGKFIINALWDAASFITSSYIP